MSEEKQVEQQPEQQETTQSIEDVARAHGWRPKEEFDADPANEGKRWRSAEEYMELQPVFDKVRKLARQNRELQEGLNALAEHNRKIERLAYEKALRELREEKRKALEEQDFSRVSRIEEQIDALKDNPPKAPVINKPQVNEVFEEWVDKNPWYKQDPDMRAQADGYAIQLWGQGMRDPEEVLPLIERKIKEMFPTRFRNPNKDKASNLEGGQRKESRKSEDFKLTESEEKILNTMLRAGAPITREEYIKQLKETRS